MNETFEFFCTKMQKAIDKQWVELTSYPHTNTITFSIDSLVLVYCPFCGEYLPETSNILANQSLGYNRDGKEMEVNNGY